MRITFIKPCMVAGLSRDAVEPLVFGILAALTPSDIELRLYDERIEPIDFDEPTDLVAITCETYSARRSYQIAAAYRRRGVPVVIGGYHPTLWTGEVQRYVETVVVGDAEDTWPVVLEDARRGRLQRLYRSRNPALMGLRVDRSIFRGKRYGSMRLVQLGRGCIHRCDFCSVSANYGSRIRTRPVGEVLAEIEALGARAIIFTDDNLFANRPLAEELLRGLEPLKVRWSCQAMLDVAADEALLKADGAQRLPGRNGGAGVVARRQPGPDAQGPRPEQPRVCGTDPEDPRSRDHGLRLLYLWLRSRYRPGF
jgi:radical SAM superfamily enzyme YgiQ (UPF0313 family)